MYTRHSYISGVDVTGHPPGTKQTRSPSYTILETDFQQEQVFEVYTFLKPQRILK